VLKVVWVARFRDGVPRHEAQRHWLETHAELGARVPGLVRYTQNHVVGPLPVGSGPLEEQVRFDGYSLGWFADAAAYDAAIRSPEWRAQFADRDNVFDIAFFDGSRCVVEERLLRDGPATPLKVAWFVRFAPGRERAELREHWANVHGPLSLELPGLRRYVQNHPLEAVADEGRTGTLEGMRFEAFSEAWWDDRAAFDVAMASPERAPMAADGDRLWDRSTFWAAFVEEHTIKG
jgi:uncharacterized protein (TIGR02118 family)